MLSDVTNHGSTPPCVKQGQKNDHSPWSAPRERKRRSKLAVQEAVPVALCSIEEIEYTTSPPKRHNGAWGWDGGVAGAQGGARGPF